MCHTITPERPNCHNNAYPLIDKILPHGGRDQVRKPLYGRQQSAKGLSLAVWDTLP